ncbi:MAG: diacylglycerol kinase family protein [Opitutus sp.]
MSVDSDRAPEGVELRRIQPVSELTGMNVIVVYNEKAGTSVSADGPTREALQDAFAAAGITADVRNVPGDQIEASLREAVRERPTVLYAGGGDGTISTAAGLVAGTNIVLGVLPLGTLNHFARDLGIPSDWREAVAALVAAPVRAVDVAEVNGRVFINNCSLGSYADAVRRRDALRREKGHGKWPAMILASWAVFRELRRMRLQITTPDTTLTLRTPFVLIANNQYTGSVLATSLRPKLDEGRIWLYTTRARKHGALIRLAWQSLVRRIDAADDLEVHSFTHATITVLRGRIPVAADGEIVNATPPLQLKIKAGALRVLAPPTVTS